jgi:DNA helicase IV
VAAFCETVWPARDPAGLVLALWTDAALLARAARGILTDEEQALLSWAQAPRSVRTAPWTAADAVLVDEVAGLLDRTPGYGHVVLDEAQDLSPMECRAVGRRLAAGSLTVLGDLAQATSPWAAADWQQTLTGLGRPDTAVRPLTRGYRVPSEVLDYANRLLPVIAPGLPPATAIRSEPGSLRVRPAAALAGPLIEVVGELAAAPGSIGVVCADAAVAEVLALLTGAGLAAEALDDDAEAPALAVVPASLVKGLEFDAVVVIDPQAILAQPLSGGAGALYTALTRSTRALAIVHADTLPPALASSPLLTHLGGGDPEAEWARLERDRAVG